MRQSTITRIPKKGDLKDLRNWRPINLLSVDYKIMTKALTKRFQSHLPAVIAADQTCSIPERSINDNLLMVRDVILHSQERGSPLGLLSLDHQIRRIPGYQLPGAGGERLRVMAYMDDITIVGTDSRSITTATKAVDDYCAATGALVNRGKSELFLSGHWHETLTTSFPVKTETIKLLGITFTWLLA
ncbi:hypothetical protein DPEC_G00110000 [Dallia pectoralis]|uniref:Uncharacterized protein n=1 Tax=Dallia pectoralis TaxID=75939 RepID=A0ACC2GSQ9_DALPE|nr:hypothetical protein DPEC_G00110000 [Dallia pectoralis]